MKNIKPIDTYYKGYRFRSRLEARWAVFFDYMGIDWVYEEQGYTFPDGTCYLPDFYLPESHTFFEVKGSLSEESAHKIELLLKAGCRVAVGYSVGTFQATVDDFGCGFSLENFDNSAIAQCRKCGKYWFLGFTGDFTCPCCGEYDGDRHLNAVAHSGDLTDAVKTARGARFEHGETPEVV